MVDRVLAPYGVDGKVTAVLHTRPVDSPAKAVRAAILSEE